MPTASTSQILGNNECFEPYTSNIYVRRVLSGEFTVVNQHLLADLTAMNLWNPALKNELVAANGSVQGLDIPMHLKQLYKTVWEIKQRILVDMAADRGAYIDQSQSFNVHLSDPNFGKLTSLHFHTWRKGLKTGMYYLRTRAAADAIKFTVDQESLLVNQKKAEVPDAAAVLMSPSRSQQVAAAQQLLSPSRSQQIAAAQQMLSPARKALSLAGADGMTHEEREAQLARMVCSIENKDACLMCGS
eukprot:GHRQ01035280.1.p1 GENE.GHRQ01035280.1~~GHRQ01035280.1.p1  ORF type:complete len:245 (+),score=138.02 GHRQ01035280.1:1725-2459(+)